ncbi:hypothetical protein BJX64DRAFT_270769 [Aspergillus heterothallicus]
MQVCRDTVGVGSDGWVPTQYYEEAKRLERKLWDDAMEVVELREEEKVLFKENWIFDDFDEDEYM